MSKQVVEKISSIIVSLLTISACTPQYVAQPDDPRYTPIIPDVAEIPKAKGGSIFVAGTGLALYQDMKAHRVGDIITVKLVETTKATKDAKTNYKKEYDTNHSLPTILGTQPNSSILSKIPFLHSKNGANLATTIDADSEFKGSGDSAQNNSLTGDITVTVSQVLTNNNLLIKGEKWITLNQGSEYIRFSGIVRQQDIGPNNEVLSTRVADARITYSGKGAVASANKAGLLARFFNSEWFLY